MKRTAPLIDHASMTFTAAPRLATTRESWHRLAEHVLAAGQFAAAGTIRLRAHPGGFRTTVGVHGRQLAVVGNRLIVDDDAGHRSAPVTTLRAAAAFAGVAPGLRDSYSPATRADLDTPLPVDPESARLLADWYALGDAALRRFADELGSPQNPVLWPEHFDLGITVNGVNYGCSPGDDVIGAPYFYVGPHELPPRVDPFWNAPFGGAATPEGIRTADDAVAFFEQGRALTERSRT